jgi:hypothetical protein
MNSSMKSLFFVILLVNILLLVPIGADVIAMAKFNNKIHGVVEIAFNGEAEITVDIKDGLDVGLVYPFHVHEFTVKDHNCTSTGGHLDPTSKYLLFMLRFY